LDKPLHKDNIAYQHQQSSKTFNKNYKGKTANQIIKECPSENAAIFLSFIDYSNHDEIEIVKEFLIKHLDKFNSGRKGSSNFRKLACYYDKLVYGW
jgi:hypothetical protein